MSITSWLGSWPLVRQLARATRSASASPCSRALARRCAAHRRRRRVVGSICPYCAVGCGQLVYVKDGEVVQIEGDPASPISRGRLCPKGSASLELVHEPAARVQTVKYRRPYGTEWEELAARRGDGHDRRPGHRDARRDLAGRRTPDGDAAAAARSASRNLGGATLDNEENYLIKKLLTALGVVQVENQARI